MTRSPRMYAALGLGMGTLVLAGSAPGRVGAQANVGFTPPVFVDKTLGGGEPFVTYSPISKLLVYTAHEGTTHIFAANVPGAPAESGAFIANYRNQVNIFTSADNGTTWQVVNFLAGFMTDPTKNTGFSDPDLTTDEGGNIYNTGIDLANDALFSSPDGGKTWPTGTIQCHEGDRPWLAGGKANEVFLATDADNSSGTVHTVFQSTDAGASCGSTGIADPTGDGKLFYDHTRGSVVEPTWDSVSHTLGVGILPHASSAFGATPGSFSNVKIAAGTSLSSHWPSMTIDSAGNYYMVWDTDDRQPNTTGGCQSGQTGFLDLGTSPLTPLANSVMMSTSHDGGLHWTKPVAVAHSSSHRVLWPWVTVGSPGNVGVVWYSYDQVTDPDCGTGNVSVMAAQISNALDPARMTETVVDAAGRPIHTGAICMGGTTCAVLGGVTGEDRRLGDFFTVATDVRGCILVATGDSTLVDALTGQPSPVSHPLFLRQNRGTSLTGQDCANPGATTAIAPTSAPTLAPPVAPSTGAPSGLVNTSSASGRAAPVIGLIAVGAVLGIGRRRRRPRPR